MQTSLLPGSFVAPHFPRCCKYFKMLGSHLLSSSLAAVVVLVSVANADYIRGQAMLTGQNTAGGTCSFSNYTLPREIYGVGIGGGNWASGNKCGTCLEVFGPGGSAKVMVSPRSRLISTYLTMLSLCLRFPGRR